MYIHWVMDEVLAHTAVQMLESRVSNLTPSYWRREGDNRPYARIYYIKSGSGFIRPFGREFALRPGWLYLVPPRGDLSYGCTTDTQIWWMHFTATLYGGIDLFDYLPYRIERRPKDLRELEGRMARLLEAGKSPHPADQIEGIGILLGLVAPFFREPDRPPRPEFREGLKRFLPVLKHIDEHLGGPVSVGDLARIARYETSHFSTLFSKLFGLPPKKYVHRRRIERVQIVLQRSGSKLEVLARQFGFHDAFHLSRAFKRATGLSPRDFRKARKEWMP